MGWSDAKSGGLGCGVQSPVPDRDHHVGVPDGQGAGKVDNTGASQRVQACRLTCMLLDGSSEFNWTGSGPVAGPCLLRRIHVFGSEVVIASGGGQRGPHLGIGQAALHRSVASIPQLSRQVASRFFGQQLHEGAGIEIDQGHSSAPLLADNLGQRPARARPRTSRCPRTLRRRRPTDDPVGCQAL